MLGDFRAVRFLLAFVRGVALTPISVSLDLKL